jgi:hypothetical protein
VGHFCRAEVGHFWRALKPRPVEQAQMNDRLHSPLSGATMRTSWSSAVAFCARPQNCLGFFGLGRMQRNSVLLMPQCDRYWNEYMKRNTAEAIRSLVLHYGGALDKSVYWNREDADYRRLVGNVLGRLFANLLLSVFAEYPDLEPPELSSEVTLQSDPGQPSPGRLFQALLVKDLMSELGKLQMIIESDDTINEKGRAREDLAEVFDHLVALRVFVGMDPET